jgi:hypothetical protein
MRQRYVGLGIALALLTSGALGYVMFGMHLYERYHLAYANYQFANTGPCGALIAWSPPHMIYTGLYVNTPELMSLRYRSPTPQVLRISMSIPELTQEQTVQVSAEPAFQTQAFKPPLLGGAALDALVSPGQREAQIQLRVQSEANTICETTAPVLLKSRQWMHWYDSATGTDYAPYLAGWVTPNAPVITSLIGQTAAWMSQHAGNYPGTTGLIGYDGGHASQQDVQNQVDALFDTLEQVDHVAYAQDNVPYSQDATQLIKLPRDILSSPYPSGMCVETTAILASAVEALGMRPYFIIVPGHAYLGVALGTEQAAPLGYWETSYLNGVSGAQANRYGSTTEYDPTQVLRVIDVQFERSQGIEPIE